MERLRAENEAALEYDKSMRRQLSELKDCSGSASSERAWLALEEWEQQNPKPQATEAPPEPIKG